MITDWRDMDLQSLDLVLCAGRGKLSKKIQWFQRLTGAPREAARISHLAGIYREGDNKFIELQESTTMNKWANKRGVQKNLFGDWLENYNGAVFIRKMDFKRTLTFKNDDLGFWMEHQNDDYENGIPGYTELVLCGLRLHRYVRKIPFLRNYEPHFTEDPHCTELQANRIYTHKLWYHSKFFQMRLESDFPPFNRMPPWLWWDEIDRWLTVPIGKPIQVK